jgi:hypothetical protein
VWIIEESIPRMFQIDKKSSWRKVAKFKLWISNIFLSLGRKQKINHRKDGLGVKTYCKTWKAFFKPWPLKTANKTPYRKPKHDYSRPWHKGKRAIRHKEQNHNINILSTTSPFFSLSTFIFLKNMCSLCKIHSFKGEE